MEDLRVIFLFGDPYEIVLSIRSRRSGPRGNEWVDRHCMNMGANRTRFPFLFQEDVFHLERMFDAFYRPQKFPMLTLRYESLGSHLHTVDEFLGTKLKWEPWEERAQRFPVLQGSKRKWLEKTYGALREKINDAEDAKLWLPDGFNC